jgi:preprotein translocase subunit SecF
MYAILAVSIGIVLFIAYAFRKVSKAVPSWKYGVAAIIALLHDVVITCGLFALLGRFAGIEVDISFVVALLTILGYSVNDTIVVFDRIREKVMLKGVKDFAQTVNLAVNETIGRSINTSMTVQLTLLALYFFGGETTRNFSLALIIGVFFGTYSSIFIASSVLVSWEEWRRTRK